MLTYLAIFTSKILENTLATLRIILVSNGKKKLGAILQGLITLLWILVTGTVIINLNQDIFKIIVFCLGSVVGSYLGSYLEEKIALGSNTVIAIIHPNYYYLILHELYPYKISIINFNQKQLVILLIIPRKKTQYINKLIYEIDEYAIITNLRTKLFDKDRKNN